MVQPPCIRQPHNQGHCMVTDMSEDMPGKALSFWLGDDSKSGACLVAGSAHPDWGISAPFPDWASQCHVKPL